MRDADKQQRFEVALTDEAYRRAWMYSCRLAGCRADAEDLLQESLARAFVKFNQLEDVERFTPWLLSIVRTQFLNQLRKARPAQADEYWLEVVTASPGEHPLAETLADALARLPRKQREILGLFYLDGLSQQETGQVLGLKPEVVGQRLHRARGALRRVLAKYPAMGFETQR